MTYKRLIILVGLLSSACTMKSNPETGMDVNIDVPFQKKNWAMGEYEDPNRQQNFCVLSSGNNGLKIILRKDANNPQIQQSVKSTRSMHPGVNLKVAVNQHVYRTTETFFPSQVAPRLIQDLTTGGTAYIEWRQVDSGKGGFQRFATMVNLAEFGSLYQECLQTLGETK